MMLLLEIDREYLNSIGYLFIETFLLTA